MSELKEYIVTAKSFEVVDDLCNDIESPGGNLYIPNRAVDVANPRYVSQNTHYYLTDEEAELLRKDPRVLCVNLTPLELGLEPVPLYEQTETQWNKGNTLSNTHKNWGLLRCYEGKQRTNWGGAGYYGDGIAGIENQTGTIKIDYEGKNVDVVVVDGLADPNHPEYAVNPDGSGGSRVIQFNWFSLNPLVNGSAVGTYIYGPYVGNGASIDANNNHGAHVAGTIAGNTLGWARKANIYNIYVYGRQIATESVLDYVRVWHRTKPVNPITGIKNPTIINNSWGYRRAFANSNITQVRYRGATYDAPAGGQFTSSQLANFGIFNSGGTSQWTDVYQPIDVDIIACINEGIIVVSSAGNSRNKLESPGGIDYDNYAKVGTNFYFYNLGSTPGNSGNSICVGAIDSKTVDLKAPFSNCGPEVDIYAPGSAIISSVNSGGISDPRNTNYFLAKYGGTSMAGPQVTGFLACLLEIYPNMNQEQVKEYLFQYSKTNQITNTGGGPADYTDLQGSVNRFLTYVKERLDTGAVFPKLNYKTRPSSGISFPRTRIVRFGR